jgi:hypothetical protein
MVIEARGWNGIVRLDGDRVTVERFRPKGKIGGLRGTWSATITPQMTLSSREAGRIRGGYLQVITPGQSSVSRREAAGEFDAVAKDPAGVIYQRKESADFEAMKDALQSAIARSASPITDPASVLRSLSELVTDGILSTEDFEIAKSTIIGTSPDVAQDSIRLVRQLFDLYKAGAMTEGEFNMKKWDLMSRR